ncbi:MAG: MBL fold metallo-hydrolase [Actinomycetota bacterium]
MTDRIVATRRRQTSLVLVAFSSVIAMFISLAPVWSQPDLSPETITARERFFGPDNVNASGMVRADRVILSWLSVGGLAMAIDGHVVLLDAYIHKGQDQPNYVPTTIDELVALKPDAVFIGHGHFDHAASSGEIVARTQALLIGTPEHCDLAASQARAYQGQDVSVSCIAAVGRGSAIGTQNEFFPFGPFGTGVSVRAVKHMHSAAEPPDGERHETSLTSGALPDAGSILLHPPGPDMVQNLFPFTNDEGSSILYQFKIGQFTLVWNDTGGPLRSKAPGVLAVMGQMPSTDVQLGSVLGFNDPTNGMRDIVDYVVALKPKIFFPIHHDFVTEYGMSKNLEGVFKRELARRDPQSTEIRWLYDPYDYIRPYLMTFDIANPRFAD